jgi:hypothetical protein
MTAPIGIPHDHPQAEMDAPAWDESRLLAHLLSHHDLLIGPVGKTTVALAAIHAAEHPVQTGIKPGYENER